MSEFTVVVSSNRPKLKDPEAVQRVISRFLVDRELNFGVRVHRDTGQPYLVLSGYEWPEAWPLPEGIVAADFDPYLDEAVYSQGANGFKDLLRQLAPFSRSPLPSRPSAIPARCSHFQPASGTSSRLRQAWTSRSFPTDKRSTRRDVSVNEGGAVSKSILLDEFHIAVRIPPNLADRQVAAIRRTLSGRAFRSSLRRCLRERRDGSPPSQGCG